MVDAIMASSQDGAMRTTVDLTDEQIAALDPYCKREGISRVEAVRRAVAAFVAQAGKRKIDFKAHPAFGSSKRYRREDSVITAGRLREEWQ